MQVVKDSFVAEKATAKVDTVSGMETEKNMLCCTIPQIDGMHM
jgi:hypothetical protein